MEIRTNYEVIRNEFNELCRRYSGAMNIHQTGNYWDGGSEEEILCFGFGKNEFKTLEQVKDHFSEYEYDTSYSGIKDVDGARFSIRIVEFPDAFEVTLRAS